MNFTTENEDSMVVTITNLLHLLVFLLHDAMNPNDCGDSSIRRVRGKGDLIPPLGSTLV